MAVAEMTPIVPLEPSSLAEVGVANGDLTAFKSTIKQRINITRPPDRDNELIQVAAVRGPLGVLAVIRTHREYAWIVSLGFRAIEVCLSPRSPVPEPASLEDCDRAVFQMQLLEVEAIDEIFELMKHYNTHREIQRAGLAVMELLIVDDRDWRDEVARKGGIALLCDIAKQHKDAPTSLCQVMTCISYLAAEDYIEVMLCQHDALEYVAYVLEKHVSHAELITIAAMALVNLTACESHVEELYDRGALKHVLEVFRRHHKDPHMAIIFCAVFAQFSVNGQCRDVLANSDFFQNIEAVMVFDSHNALLQVACLKALVNYSLNPGHWKQMESMQIPDLVKAAMKLHPDDPGVQRYGNYFLGNYSSCLIL